MAHKKAGGSTRNIGDSKPKYLGIKIADGDTVKSGTIIVRQRGTRYLPGKNVALAKDHTIFSLIPGKVKFGTKRKTSFTGELKRFPIVHVV